MRDSLLSYHHGLRVLNAHILTLGPIRLCAGTQSIFGTIGYATLLAWSCRRNTLWRTTWFACHKNTHSLVGQYSAFGSTFKTAATQSAARIVAPETPRTGILTLSLSVIINVIDMLNIIALSIIVPKN